MGINIEGTGSDDNLVVGNYIGSLPSEAAGIGNGSSGVMISGSTHGNRIGPGNTIAENGTLGSGCGVILYNVDTYRTTITESNIYHNPTRGICLIDGANESIEAPVVTSVELVGSAVTD